MHTLLSTGPLPFWAYIFIISVGSLIMVAALSLSIRYCVIRRRSKEEVYPSLSAELPTRQLTLRRGRLVPASHYHSLTGSKFGFNQFNEMEAGINIDGQKSRSRSPFEWWKTVNSQPRNDASPSTESKPVYPTIEHNPDGTLTTWREKTDKKDDDPLRSHPPKSTQQIMVAPSHVSNQIMYPPSITPRPTRQTNFSTPFDSRCNSAYRPPLLSKTTSSSLPRIVETSAHQSMVARQSQLSLARQSQLSLAVVDRSKNNSKVSVSEVQPVEEGDHLSSASAHDAARLPPSLQAEEPRRSSLLEFKPASPSIPLGFPENRRSSGPGPENKPSSYRKPEPEVQSNRPRSSLPVAATSQAAAAPVLSEPSAVKVASDRTTTKPVRVRSGKGNVLRKKSLRKAERVSHWS